MRQGIKKFILLGSVPVLGLAWALFRPELIFVNQQVNEKLTVSAGQTAMTLAKGEFKSYSHETTGNAEIVKVGDKWILRLSNFKTSNGPDVHVIVGKNSDPKSFKATDSVDLGVIKGNIGDQNYVLPSSISPEDIMSVTIWCKRFSVSFGGASLKSMKAATPVVQLTTPSSQTTPVVQLAGFAEEIRVTGGKLKSGTVELIEADSKRFLRLTKIKLPNVKSAQVFLVKAETLPTTFDLSKLTKVKLGDWSSAKSKQQFAVSKDLDLWLYRTIIFWNPATKRSLGTVNLRSDQELRPTLNLI